MSRIPNAITAHPAYNRDLLVEDLRLCAVDTVVVDKYRIRWTKVGPSGLMLGSRWVSIIEPFLPGVSDLVLMEYGPIHWSRPREESDAQPD